jgi:cation diffusion facilitator CzcD-associated flavoprotein CzcO
MFLLRWFNRYPGAACDVSSPLYSLSHFLNPWWSRAYSHQGEIEDYLFEFAEKFDLLRHITFKRSVTKCDWNETTQKWTVTTDDGVTRETNFVVSGIGALHSPFKPDFKDKVFWTEHCID